MKCPECGHVSDGNFCPNCGASLNDIACPACGEPTAPGARFCIHCGERLDDGAGGIPWRGIAAAAVLVIVVIAVVLAYRSPNRTATTAATQTATAPFAGSQGGAADAAETGPPNMNGAAGIDPLAGGPRVAADRLFNRIMSSMESGDTSNARFFAPMALKAYGMAAPLDDDGLYHVALIQLVAGQPDSARATAQKILEKSPKHLLALAVAAQAEDAEGNTAAARALYQRFLDAYPTESKKALPEYEDHAKVLPVYRQDAEKYLGK